MARAPRAVRTAFLALAGALAFGLGGREVAADLLRSAVDAGQENKEQVKQDARIARDRGEQQAQQTQSQAQTRIS